MESLYLIAFSYGEKVREAGMRGSKLIDYRTPFPRERGECWSEAEAMGERQA
jgi:hypothetical protein